MESGSEIFLDTSVWIAWFRREPRAERLLERLADHAVVSSPLVLAELASLAARGRVDGALETEVRAGARLEAVTVEDALAGGRIHGRTRGRKGSPSIVDSILLATARRLGILFLTTDQGLAGEPSVELLR